MDENETYQPDLLQVPQQPPVDPREDPAIQKALNDVCKTLDMLMIQFLQGKEKDYSVTRDKNQNNLWYYEPYVDYNDELSDSTIKEMFDSDAPMQYIEEHLNECYRGAEWDSQEELLGEFGAFPGVSELLEIFEQLAPGTWDDYVQGALWEHWYLSVPFDHYLNRMVNVTMQIDTGDGNYDYSLNAACVYPQFRGLPVTLDPLASISWLVKQQGHTRGQLRDAINKEQYGDSKFMKSVRSELFELTSSMGSLVVLLQMTLKECLRISQYIKNESPLHDKYAANRSKGTGYLVVGKAATVGLFDYWNGAGSTLEIALEKDLRVPFRYIQGFTPDCCSDHGVDRVYGLCSSCWAPGKVLEVKPMKGRGNDYTGEQSNEK